MIYTPSLLGTLLFIEASGASSWAVPTWTDKEVLIALGSAVVALIPVVLFIFRFSFSRLREKVRKARLDNEQLKKKVEVCCPDGPTPNPGLAEITRQLEDAQRRVTQLVDEIAGKEVTTTTAVELAAIHERHATELKESLKSLQGKFDEYESLSKASSLRIQKALGKDGQTWTEKVKANATKFRSLEPDGRRMPILSVLNLKGGVGKTTICANLGAALDGMGYRVLLLDLDLQGSLTSLFFSETEQKQLFEAERTLADFLSASFVKEYPDLRDYTRAILPGQKSGLVPTSDYLAYADTNLTIRWLLREGNKDPRFLLRRELQLARITNDYDIVLLDCPPLINVCCVNALTASDYLVIPVMPSKQATSRTPILLRRLREFRENTNPALKVMGIVANRTHRTELTTDEDSRLSLLRKQCFDVLGEAVPQFERFIRQTAEFRAVEDECRPLRTGDEMYSVFLELAREVESRLPTFCRPAARPASPAKEVVS